MVSLNSIVTMQLRSQAESKEAQNVLDPRNKGEADEEVKSLADEGERGSDGDYVEAGTGRAKRGEPTGKKKSSRGSRTKKPDAIENNTKPDKTTKSGSKKGPPSKESIKKGRKRANDRWKDEKQIVRGLEEKVKAREMQIQELISKLRDKEETIVALQIKSHAHIGNQEKPLYPDDEVRRMFQSTFRIWGKFTRKWANSSISKGDKICLVKLHAMLVKTSPALGSERAVTAVHEGHIEPYLLLHALLARAICNSTFDAPLDFLRMVKICRRRRGLAHFLRQIYELGSRRR